MYTPLGQLLKTGSTCRICQAQAFYGLGHDCQQQAILLHMQAVVVLLACLAYEFYLLQKCNVANMRSFAVFLALPSATVRTERFGRCVLIL